MATAPLELKQASDVVKTHDLFLEEVEKNHQLPLFGDFCCRFAVQPECQMKEFMSGLILLSEVSSKSEFTLFWCSLKNFKLSLWSVKDELKNEPVFLKHTVNNIPPSTIIPINKNTKITHQTDFICITNGENTYYFKCFTGSPIDWYKAFLATKEALIAWEPIAEYQMDLTSPSQQKSNYLFRSRLPGSLYDETPIHGIYLICFCLIFILNFLFFNLRNEKTTFKIFIECFIT